MHRRAQRRARASVRFYVASGLLDRPEGTGTAATYNYRHLLQLLAIKIRQREGQSLETIKIEMKDVTGDALERRIATSLAPALTSGADTTAEREDGNMSLAGVALPSPMESSSTFAKMSRRLAKKQSSRCAKPSARRSAARTFARSDVAAATSRVAATSNSANQLHGTYMIRTTSAHAR